MRFLFVFLLFLPCVLHAQSSVSTAIKYVENKGQWKENIQYKAEIEGANLWVENNTFTFDFISQEDLKKVHDLLHDNKYNASFETSIKHHVYKVNFLEANETVNYIGDNSFSTYHNYFLGSDSANWAGKVPLYAKILGQALYDGIDIKSYSNDGHYKYDFIIHPGADPAKIKMEYEGVDMKIFHKQLRLNLEVGEVIENAPIAYQIIEGKRKKVQCQYQLDKNVVSFIFPNGYNKEYALVIDPELIFSTYTGSTADNWGFTATYDESGNLYGGGIVFSTGYPTSTGAYDQLFNGGTQDIAITKYTSDGSDQIYSTYLGGNLREWPHSLMVDSDNHLVVMGSSESNDYPTTDDAYSPDINGGIDIIVTKFNESGSALLASTFLGGANDDGKNNSFVLRHNYGDDSRGEVFIDTDDIIYIASVTSSTDFPTTDLSEEQSHQGGQDGVVVAFTPELDSLLFSSYLGGSQDDAAYSIKKKESLIVVGGGTASSNFPTTSTSLNPTYLGGSTDGFVLSLDSNGSIYNSSFIGTDAYDQTYFVEIDPEFHVFLTGQTEGTYPVSSGVYFNENGSQFVQEMSSELSVSILSTVFGTGGTDIDISPTAFLVDQCDHVYISGWGGIQGTGSTTGLPVTPDAFQSTTDGFDFYFIVFGSNFQDLLYATYFGGVSVNGEHVDGGTSRFDDDGVIYQAVCAGCGGTDLFPTTEGAWSQTNGSTNCNLGTLKMEFNFQGLNAVADVNDSVYCQDPPFELPFFGSGTSSQYNFWSFGDGETSNLVNPIHSYEEEGVYDIMYVLTDSNTCNITDTAYATIEVIQKEVFSMEWEATPPSLCDDTLFVEMSFTGTGADSLIWDMGDGTIIYNEWSIAHTYFDPGIYNMSLTAFDLDCDQIEIGEQTYILSENVVSGELEVPNIFSPNGDGVNDEFRLFFKDKPAANPLLVMDFYSVIIYNRWGRTVFESGSSISDWAWDGTIDGKKADEGVYYYILLYNSICEDNGTSRRTGYITLVR